MVRSIVCELMVQVWTSPVTSAFRWIEIRLRLKQWDSLSMIVLTLPVIFPIAQQYGMDPVWFGILVVTVTEIGLITPPVALNLFVVQGLMPQAGQGAVVRSIRPFIAADLLRVVILAAIPAISLILPRSLGY
jgi:TRAP-type C4-dicarboxylate transport system permease large subunit